MYQSRARSPQLPSLSLMCAAMLSACLCFSTGAHATVTTGTMGVARMNHQASALPDGRVLFTGGYAAPGTVPYTSAEIYDPATGLFTPVAPMQTPRTNHAAVTLSDGRVMVIGGSISTNVGLVGTATSEIFDPATGLWTNGGTMNSIRWRAMAKLLPSGKVFVMNMDSNSATPEVYDPQTGLFTKTGLMNGTPGWPGLVVLADGRVMSVGGYSQAYLRTADIWDPATNKWTLTGPMIEARQDFRPVLLPDGKVLVAGGSNQSTLRTTEIYDPATGVFTAGSQLPEYLNIDLSATLPNGDIMLTGPYTSSLMHYSAATGTWTATGPKATRQNYGSVTSLPDGNLLFAGGATQNNASNYAAVWNQACAPQKIALTGATQAFPGDGGTVNVNVTAAPGCRFEVAGMPAWLTLSGPATMEMPAAGTMSVSFSALVNSTGVNRSAAFKLGNTPVTLTQVPSFSCPATPTVSPASFTFGYGAQSGSIGVTTVASCPWTISSLPAWVNATSPTSGTGNGSVTFSVPVNTGVARSGNGQLNALGGSSSFTFSQAASPACPAAPVLYPSSLSFEAAAVNGTILVSAGIACPWTVGSLPSWITTTGGSGSGTGNGSFTYAVASNPGPVRSGYVVVTAPGTSGTYMPVVQQVPTCQTWSVSPTSASFAATGASGSFTVSAASNCAWRLNALPTWMSATTTTSGSGNGSIGYTVLANSGAARSATMSITGSGPGLSINLSQLGSGTVVPAQCINPISSGVAVSGNLQPSTCGAGARGASYKTDRYTFTGAPGQQVTIFASSSSFDTYLYLRNPNGTVIASNDDGGGGTNSRIPASSGTYTLTGTSGTFTIEVSSYSTSGAGPYSLSLTK